MIQKAIAMGNWWLTASSWQCARSSIMSPVEFSCKTSNHWGDSPPLQPRFGALQLLAFPKTKIIFEREEISNHCWDLGQYDRAADGDWENCVRSQGIYNGTEVPLSYVQCFMYLVSSSVNVSTFHIAWLDTFWTDLKHITKEGMQARWICQLPSVIYQENTRLIILKNYVLLVLSQMI